MSLRSPDHADWLHWDPSLMGFSCPTFGLALLILLGPVLHFLSVLNMGAALAVLQVPAEQGRHTFCCAFFPLDSCFSPK